MEFEINGEVLEIKPLEDFVSSNLDHQLKEINEIMDKNPKQTEIMLNMENINEIDSLGINLVVGLYKHIISQTKKFSVCKVSKPIKNLFNLFKLSSYFEVK